MKHADALKIAEEWVERLRPVCTRIEIAGSVRRNKPEVHDIEIVAIPDLSPVPRPRPTFGQSQKLFVVHRTKLDAVLYEARMDGAIGLEKNGEKYKKLVLFDDAGRYIIKLDLFLVTPPAKWGVQYVIRTGPGSLQNNFSQWIVTQRHLGGHLPNGYRVQCGAVWEGEIKVPDDELDPQKAIGFDEEMDFLTFLELGWIEPSERRAKWIR